MTAAPASASDGRSGAPGVLVAADALEDFTRRVFEAAGLSREHAGVVADALVRTSVRGVDSHGVMRIPLYVRRIKAGFLNPRPNIRVIREHGATALIDADDAMGHVATTLAMDKAIELAHRYGVACVGVRNSSHFGAAGHYLLRALDADVAAMLFTNGPPVMAPARGREARICNNPIAVGVPSDGPAYYIHDIAMSVAAGGKIRLAEQEGRPIPDNWVLTADGRRTTDPRDAVDGILLPMNDHKGYGLAFFSEAITGVLMGSAFGLGHKAQWDTGRGADDVGVSKTGHTIVALSCAAFCDVAVFKSRLAELVDQLHATEVLEGEERVVVPGEPEQDSTERRLANGVPISSAVLARIVEVADELGVDSTVLRSGKAA